jgi:hypothetical protein
VGKAGRRAGAGREAPPPSTGWASQFVMVSFCPTDVLAGAKTAISNWVTTYLRLGGRNIVRTLTPLRHWFVESDTLVLQQATTLSDIGVKSCPENGSCRIIRPMRIQRRARPVLSFHVHHGVEAPPAERQEDMAAELKRLRRENEILRQEREILKRATTFFAKEGSR